MTLNDEFEILFDDTHIGDRLALVAMISGDTEALRRVETLIALNELCDAILNNPNSDWDLITCLANEARAIAGMKEKDLWNHARQMDHHINLNMGL